MEIQHRVPLAFCCILLVLSFLVSNSDSTQEKEAEILRKNNKNPSKWKLLSSPPYLTLSAYLEAIKNKYLPKAPSYVKPNTEFRGKVDKEEGGAVEKSVEKAKETIEESAKSAAKMATETADKLKITKSHKTDPQDEL
ncbi:hypothetical protein V2J09_004580 [Rumex salicifolius]